MPSSLADYVKPTTPDNKVLSLTAEQLFRVYEHRESPRKVIERDIVDRLIDKKLENDIMGSVNELTNSSDDDSENEKVGKRNPVGK